jgi:sulfur-carrier protein
MAKPSERVESRCELKIMFYGRLADAIGPELDFRAAAGCSVTELRDQLLAEHPEIGEALRSKRAKTFVGDTLVPDDYRLAPGDTVQFLPPVSGG